MNLRNTIVISFFCLNINQLFSQNNDLDDQYTPKGNTVLDGTSKKNSSSSDRNSDYPVNIIKFIPFSIARSIIAVHYERNLFESVSIVGGLGFNYNIDPMFKLFGSEIDFDRISSNRTEHVSLADIYKNSTFDGPSPYFFVAPKFIWDSYWNEGYSYIELAYKHYGNNLTYSTSTNYSSSNYTTINVSESINVSQNYFLINWGHQFFTRGKIATCHEFYVGFGIRTSKYDPINIIQTSNPNNGNSTTSYVKGSTRATSTGIVFNIGYAFGIGFGSKK